jgi:hypothetical protein
MCSTFLTLLYSAVVPNEDLEGVVSGLEERGAPSLESETVVQQAIGAAGPLAGVYCELNRRESNWVISEGLQELGCLTHVGYYDAIAPAPES